MSVLHRVSTTYPHRFLLADEVGLGKAIQAGLILKELKARGVANRVLVLAPAGITSQWQFELKNKFAETFSLYRRDTINFLLAEHPGENAWTLRDNVITSSPTPQPMTSGCATSPWLAGMRSSSTRRITPAASEKAIRTGEQLRLYELAELLTDPSLGRAQAFLLLTATPMQLDPSELYSLIELLDPALFPDFADFEEHRSQLAGLNGDVDAARRWPTLSRTVKDRFSEEISLWVDRDVPVVESELDDPEANARLVEELLAKHRLSEVMIRNRKAVVAGIMPRVAAVWPVEMSEAEWEAYDAIGTYVRSGYARSQAIRNNALGFLMTTFQKLSSSSWYALRGRCFGESSGSKLAWPFRMEENPRSVRTISTSNLRQTRWGRSSASDIAMLSVRKFKS